MKRKYSIGSRFKLSLDALENYGCQYQDKVFTVSHWSDHYAKPGLCCGDNPIDPHGHPGFDESAGSPIYDAHELSFSVYEWEMVPA